MMKVVANIQPERNKIPSSAVAQHPSSRTLTHTCAKFQLVAQFEG